MVLLVFDFDGPLFDGRAAMWEALKRTQKELHGRIDLVLPPQSTLPLARPAALIGLVCPEAVDADRKAVTDLYRQHLKDIEQAMGLPEEVRRTLNDLHGKGCKLALFSGRSEDDLNALVNRLGIGPLLIKPAGRAAAPPKPSGAYLRLLQESAGARSDDVILVGDSDFDYLAAADAGVTYYHADWTGEPSSEAPRKAAWKLSLIAELASIFIRTAVATSEVDERDLYQAVRTGEFCFYAGAGISVPSGVGDWQRHYLPVLEQLGASYLCKETNLLEALQLLCAEPLRARGVFDAFRRSFDELRPPNAYHYAMLRASPTRIWTSNYDRLFERAISLCGFSRVVVNADSDLLDNFGASMLVKMNGDFAAAKFREDLDWNAIFLQEQFDRAEVQRPEIWRLFEDDYRNRTLVFVGVSFTDPALRRIVSVARRKIARTRCIHYLLQKRVTDPAGRNQQAMFAENLRRSGIVTIFKDTYDELADIVRQIPIHANRPIVGFSGDGGSVPGDRPDAGDLIPSGMDMKCGDIAIVCRALAEGLARQGYRVSSGGAQFVGIPAVEAAFDLDPNCARFYLRRRGGRLYPRTAPAIVVGGSDYRDMRRRFIPELSFLVGIGGQPRDDEKSGTLEEVLMALDLGIPALLVPQAGGDVAKSWASLRERMRSAYRDAQLATAVGELNDRVRELSQSELLNAAGTDLATRVHGLIRLSMGAETRDSDGAAFRQRQLW